MLSIVIPCFNESLNLRRTVNDLIATLIQNKISHEIIIVDDSSSDSTLVVANELQSTYVRVLSNEKNSGKGASVMRGMCHSNSNYLSYIDADGDISVNAIVEGFKILEANPNVDACFGSKRHPKSRVKYPITRVAMSKIFKLLIKVLFRYTISDTQTGVKIIRASSFLAIREHVKSTGFAFDLDLFVNLKRNGASIVEIPVEIHHRFDSTVNLSSVFHMFIETIEIYKRTRSQSQK